MLNRRSVVKYLLVSLLLAGVVGTLVSADPDPSGGDVFCTLDAPLAEPPDGWEFQRDRANDCAMTLIDDNGRRAPAELYKGLPIDPPPPLPLNRVRLATLIGVLVSLVGLTLMWLDDRRRRVADAAN